MVHIDASQSQEDLDMIFTGVGASTKFICSGIEVFGPKDADFTLSSVTERSMPFDGTTLCTFWLNHVNFAHIKISGIGVCGLNILPATLFVCCAC